MRRISSIISVTIAMFILSATIGFGVSAVYENDERVIIPKNHLVIINEPTMNIVAELKEAEEKIDRIIEELIADNQPIKKPDVVIVPIEEFEEVTTEETTTKVVTTEEATTKVVTTKEITTKAVTTEKETTKVSTTKAEITTKKETTSWNGKVLNKTIGTVNGPSGKETYYNLNMSGVVRIMRNMGYGEEKYPYHIREDGVKMLGPYIMCAANLSLRPRGTILETSLGKAIVCDTGEFAKTNQRQLDIAVNW